MCIIETLESIQFGDRLQWIVLIETEYRSRDALLSVYVTGEMYPAVRRIRSDWHKSHQRGGGMEPGMNTKMKTKYTKKNLFVYP